MTGSSCVIQSASVTSGPKAACTSGRFLYVGNTMSHQFWHEISQASELPRNPDSGDPSSARSPGVKNSEKGSTDAKIWGNKRKRGGGGGNKGISSHSLLVKFWSDNPHYPSPSSDLTCVRSTPSYTAPLTVIAVSFPVGPSTMQVGPKHGARHPSSHKSPSRSCTAGR